MIDNVTQTLRDDVIKVNALNYIREDIYETL